MLYRCNVVLIFILSAISSAWTKIVTTTNGTIVGGKCESYDVDYFLAIPYAKAPVGDLRFAAPEPYGKYAGGELKATSPATRCIQFGSIFVESGTASEDCLFIDIWAPGGTDQNSKLPVKVWLYGGSNQAGSISNALYDGCPSAKDSLVVSINYRLGPLGFLAYPDAGVQGNFAILDQLLALGWIQEQIASFGGDPDKVLLFGQSAGAEDAFVLATLPQAPSLFRSVAMESGGGRDSPNLEWTNAFYSKYIRSLGCTPDGDGTLQCLRNVSVTEMNQTLLTQDRAVGGSISASVLIADNEEGNAWLGVVDGNVIPENPAKVGVRVPAIFGSATKDGSLFVIDHYGYSVENISEADYDTFLSVSFGSLTSTVKEVYPWSDFEAYSSLQGWGAMTTIYTEASYKCPSLRGLRTAAAKGIDAWAYSWNHTNSCPWLVGIPSDPQVLHVYGPTHTGEIPFIFGQTKDLPRPNGNCTFNEAESAISDFMISAWTSMAENGRPANSSTWPVWTPENSEGITVNDVASAGFLNFTECEAFWDKVLENIYQIDANITANSTSSTSTSTSTASGSNTSRLSRGWIACLLVLLGVSLAYT